MYSHNSMNRFWAKVDRRGPDDCWPWKISTGRYGSITISGKMMYAHRLSWELVNGPIPEGICICHRCDNPLCVNPAHLFLGTQADNVADMVNKGRQAIGMEHSQSKLTEQQVRDIRGLVAGGMTYCEIEDKFGVTLGTIWAIVHRKTWRHI